MPKSKKPSKQKFSWKIALLIALGVVVALAITAQIMFDRVLWQNDQVQSTFQLRTLIGQAVDGLTDLKTPLPANNRIAEMHLQLPAPTEDIKGIIYLYDEPQENTPADVQVTTMQASRMAVGKLNVNSMDELFERVPDTQACVRGIKVEVTPTAQEGADKTKTLQDGRVLSLWREAACSQNDTMDKLQAYLLQAQSY